jgi:hypothetical protein
LSTRPDHGHAARWGCRAHPAAPSPCQRRVGRLPCPRPRRPVRALVGRKR